MRGLARLPLPLLLVGLPPPSLREGSTAELCLVDLDARFRVEPSRLRSKSKNTPFLGAELTGRVMLTMAGGRLAFEAEESSLGS